MTANSTGILLLNMGGPDSLQSVKPFLYNLFSDPDIIRLPFSEIFQKPLAWYIATNREHEAKINYALMGGASPIRHWSEAQAALLREELAKQGHGDLPVYIAMRYWHPYTQETVDRIVRDGIRRLIVLPLYPHFSYNTTGSSLNELKRVLQERNFHPELSIVTHYYQTTAYQQTVAETVREGIDNHCWDCPPEEITLLFTAHSLPQKHVKRTKDPYPDQVYETAQSIVRQYFPDNPWELSYQSQVGNLPWLGPSTDGVLHYFAGKNLNNVLMIAVSFTSDHVETLVEVDKQYLPLAGELGIRHCHRAPALNTRPTFIQCLAKQVAAELENHEGGLLQFPTFPELLQAQAST